MIAIGAPGLGWQELIVVLFIALLLFGAKRLPEIGRGLGRGIREFKDGTKGLADDIRSGLEDDEQQAQPSRDRANE